MTRNQKLGETCMWAVRPPKLPLAKEVIINLLDNIVELTKYFNFSHFRKKNSPKSYFSYFSLNYHLSTNYFDFSHLQTAVSKTYSSGLTSGHVM